MDRKTAKNLKYIVGIAVVLVFVGIAFSTTSSGSFVNPYKSVSEVVSNAQNYQGKQVQVQGYVVEGSVSWVPKNLNFTLTDEKATIKVAYYGVIPATFPLDKELDPNTQIDVVAIGTLQGDTVIANKLLVKCPSKYEAKVSAE
ncbi:cytochrome c maturation protein CcmE [Candidatus Pyrohabitans sp.]